MNDTVIFIKIQINLCLMTNEQKIFYAARRGTDCCRLCKTLIFKARQEKNRQKLQGSGIMIIRMANLY